MSSAADTARTELIGGLLLFGAAVLAIAMANSPLAPLYDRLIDTRFAVQIGAHGLDKPLLLWINDGLMALFFLLVGLELKGEILEGEFADRSKLWLPVGAALGGVLVPIAIYLGFNTGENLRSEGWAIPAATDIAFALGVLALLGRRVAPGLRTFLLSLAVVDDLIAIVIIAVYYSGKISWGFQALALAMLVVLVLFNRLGVTRYGLYLLVGALLWLFVLESGIHATLAGVAIGLTIPRRPENSLGHSPMRQLEHVLRPWVAYVVLPVFAFANAGVALRGFGFESLAHPITAGVGLGLLVGKPIGVFGATVLLIRLGLAKAPSGTRLGHLFGASLLAGIGFTMSLFIGVLAFENEARSFAVPIRLGVLGASACAALAGYSILRFLLPKDPNGESASEQS